MHFAFSHNIHSPPSWDSVSVSLILVIVKTSPPPPRMLWLLLADFLSDLIRLSLLLSNNVVQDLLSWGAQVSQRAFFCRLLCLQYRHYRLQLPFLGRTLLKLLAYFLKAGFIESEYQSRESVPGHVSTEAQHEALKAREEVGEA